MQKEMKERMSEKKQQGGDLAGTVSCSVSADRAILMSTCCGVETCGDSFATSAASAIHLFKDIVGGSVELR